LEIDNRRLTARQDENGGRNDREEQRERGQKQRCEPDIADGIDLCVRGIMRIIEHKNFLAIFVRLIGGAGGRRKYDPAAVFGRESELRVQERAAVIAAALRDGADEGGLGSGGTDDKDQGARESDYGRDEKDKTNDEWDR
jgi:hypothetical protein